MLEEKLNLKSFDGTNLHLHRWSPSAEPELVMVIAHGLGGHAAYYQDSLAPYLTEKAVVVYAPDLRGHGKSEGVRGDIEHFDELIQDLGAAVVHAREAHPDLPLVLLAESMGTSIAINYAAHAQGRYRPDGLVLAAIVIAPTIKPRLDEVLRTPFYTLTNRKKIAIPITGREEEGIRDPAFVQVLKTDPIFNKKISVRFLMEMTRNMNRAAKMYRFLTMPVLVLQGGKDITVRFGPTKAFFDKIAAVDKSHHIFADAYHAILNDPDAPQVRAVIFEWLERLKTNNTRRQTGQQFVQTY